jgi:hypothetical protein
MQAVAYIRCSLGHCSLGEKACGDCPQMHHKNSTGKMPACTRAREQSSGKYETKVYGSVVAESRRGKNELMCIAVDKVRSCQYSYVQTFRVRLLSHDRRLASTSSLEHRTHVTAASLAQDQCQQILLTQCLYDLSACACQDNRSAGLDSYIVQVQAWRTVVLSMHANQQGASGGLLPIISCP